MAASLQLRRLLAGFVVPAVLGGFAARTEAASPALDAAELQPGLEWIRIPVPASGGYSADTAHVVRIDPARWRLRLWNASAPGEGESRTAKEWSARHGLVAAINAAMFQADRRTSVSLMLSGAHANNARLSKDRAVLAFDRRDSGVPEVQIIDRDCQDFAALRRRYDALVQSIRMVSCDRRNVWSKEARRASIACLATDQAGRVLLIHVRTPQNPHDFINLLLAAPLQIRNAMYLEGGSESQLYLRAAGRELESIGQSELGLLTDSGGRSVWRIPNVLGVEPRSGGK